MNLGTARTELQARGFDYLSTTRCTILLNRGKNALEDYYLWPWLETTTTGTAPLTVSDLKQVLYVVDSTGDRELPGLDRRMIRDLDSKLDDTGVPEFWWINGETSLRVWPLNTTNTLSVDYVKFSPELSGDSDTPLIPVRYHPVWVDFAVVEAYKDNDAYDKASALLDHLTRFDIPRMVQAYAERNLQNPGYQQIRGASEDW